MGDDFLYYRLYLIHLDGVNHIILTFVFILLGSLLEATPGLLDSVVEDIGEAEQHWRRDITQSQFIHHFTQVYLRVILTGSDIDIALVIDAKIGGAPSIDVVQLLRVVDGPFLHLVVGVYRFSNSLRFFTLVCIFEKSSIRVTSSV